MMATKPLEIRRPFWALAVLGRERFLPLAAERPSREACLLSLPVPSLSLWWPRRSRPRGESKHLRLPKASTISAITTHSWHVCLSKQRQKAECRPRTGRPWHAEVCGGGWGWSVDWGGMGRRISGKVCVCVCARVLKYKWGTSSGVARDRQTLLL